MLLADDNTDMRDYIRLLLGALHEVEVVSDGEAALAAVRERRPDLLITDVMMPKLDGLGLVRAIRGDANLSDLPIIMLSARAGDEASIEGLSAGADDYLVKPFSARELTARVNAALAMARVRRENGEALRALNEILEKNVSERTEERDQLWILSQDMLARASYDGTMSAVNPAWTTVLGWSEQKLLADPFVDIIHPDDVANVVAALREMGQTGQPTRFQHRILTADNHWKPIDWTVAPDPDGVNFIAVGRDTTADKAREAELAHTQV